MRTTLMAVLLVALAGCGETTTTTAARPAAAWSARRPADDVTAARYADEWNALSESLDVSADDNDPPSTESGNWQLRLDVEESDVDKGWLLMQDFAAKFDCVDQLPARQPRDDTLRRQLLGRSAPPRA